MRTGKITIDDEKQLWVWKSRVQTEINELVDKKDKLASMINSELFQTFDLTQQTLLETQYDIMGAYINILSARIRAAGGL